MLVTSPQPLQPSRLAGLLEEVASMNLLSRASKGLQGAITCGGMSNTALVVHLHRPASTPTASRLPDSSGFIKSEASALPPVRET